MSISGLFFTNTNIDTCYELIVSVIRIDFIDTNTTQLYIVPSRNLGDEPKAGDPSGVMMPKLGLSILYGVAGDTIGDPVPIVPDGDLGGIDDDISD